MEKKKKKKTAERNALRINLHPLIGKSKAYAPLEFVFFWLPDSLISVYFLLTYPLPDPKSQTLEFRRSEVIAGVQTDLHSL